MGCDRRRFDSLGDAAREACVASARRRMGALAPEEFVAHTGVVYAVAATS